MGGGERYMLYLALALSKLPGARVTVLSEHREVSKERLQDFFSLDLSAIDYKIIEKGRDSLRDTVNGADFFIPISNFKTIRANPRTYIQALQVPYGKITPISVATKLLRGGFRDATKDLFRIQLLRFARRQARLVLSNSRFVQDTLRRNFGIDSHVLYPPQDLSRDGVTKRNIILSVGRFFRGLYNDKRYDILTESFRRMINEGFTGWEYHIVGSCSQDKESRRFLESLKELNAGYPVHFHVNEPHESLVMFYNQAKILWHAAGFQVDELRNPEKVEHFGSVAVEALSARCIPVVVNNGGLKEIVQHGKNGFLWDTTDELIQYTRQITNLPAAELETLQDNARTTYQGFALTNFNQRVMEIFSPLLANQS
jgi:glycosyltransferase involved in cell wall biosynthesis